jgi:two-component system cell cycle response regulator DivK
MNRKVLYIEDNDDNRRLVEKILLAKGYEVLLAVDGSSGWEIIQKHHPILVLLDISLPGEIDGLDIASRIKNVADPDLTWIIAITASAMAGDREFFLSNGCDDYMAKPISVRELIDKVDEVFNRIVNVKQPQELIQK